MELFEKLYNINVNDFTESIDQNGVKLTYLSWAQAWKIFKENCPDAKFEVIKNTNGLPYFLDDTGAFVYTRVSVESETHEMFLPVMDNKNKPMKIKSYEYETRYGKKTVEAIYSFAINKTIMRCLAKNIALFGLGLYIYEGEDLPKSHDELEKSKALAFEVKQKLAKLTDGGRNKEAVAKVLRFFGASNSHQILNSDLQDVSNKLDSNELKEILK